MSIVNHKEAKELALIKQEESNLARCYLELSAGATKTEKELRRLLALIYANQNQTAHLLYADDGEMQDNTMHPCIDFMQDTPAEIQMKIMERNVALNEQYIRQQIQQKNQ